MISLEAKGVKLFWPVIHKDVGGIQCLEPGSIADKKYSPNNLEELSTIRKVRDVTCILAWTQPHPRANSRLNQEITMLAVEHFVAEHFLAPPRNCACPDHQRG